MPRSSWRWTDRRTTAAFFALVLLAIVVAAWNDHRINEARSSIARNTLSIQRHHVSVVRNEETAVAVRETCAALSKLQRLIVEYLRENETAAYDYVGRIPGYTLEDARRSADTTDRAIAKFAPKPCPTLRRRGH